MIDNPLVEFFPFDGKIREIRPNQLIALNEIWSLIQQDKKRVTLCGPVGSGKSKIGETVIRYFQSQGKKCIYTSPLNSLVDQIEDTKHIDSNIVTIKGKRYYDCIAKNNGTKCDEGYCSRNICYASRNASRGNRIKRQCRDCTIGNCECRRCIYKAVFREYRHSKTGNTNCSLWLMGIVPEETTVVVLDEVDSLEDFVRMSYTVTVPYHVDGDDFAHHINVAEKYADAMEQCTSCEREVNNEDAWCAPKNRTKHQAKIDNIRNMADDFEEHKEPWVIRHEIKGDDVRTVYEPVTVTRFVDPLLEDLDFVLAMSATPPRWEGFEFIEVASPFPVDIRQCYYHPLGRFDRRNRDTNMPKLAEFLLTLKGKTIVHCNSYSFANLLASSLQKYKVFPLLQVRGKNNDNTEVESLDYETTSRYDGVNAFVTSKDPNKIYLSVNMGRGIDLWYPEIQNNIIAVVPWSDPTDLLTIAKDKVLGKSWKNESTAITIEQNHGRIHRGIYYLNNIIKTRPELSWLPVNTQGMIIKRTIITDSNFNSGKGRLNAWYQRNNQYFSKSFNESFNWKYKPILQKHE